jgi:hypothetical protein
LVCSPHPWALQVRQTAGVSLVVDRSQNAQPLTDTELRAWAAQRTVFISSEMRDLRAERRVLADALRAIGLNVVMFEDLGGREDDAATAYLDGVARSNIYLGVVADRYGTMLASGRSPTHEEYREARRRGLRIAVWVAADDPGRQGDARDFVAEVRTFHTTGTYSGPDDLVASVVARLREIAAEEESPWVKLGHVVFRADSIQDDGRHLTITMQSRDREVLAALEALRPGEWGRGPQLSVVAGERAGTAQVTEVASQSSSATERRLTMVADVRWADGRRPSLAAGLNGVSVEEQVEVGLAAGLFAERLPERLGGLAGMVDSSDPLSDLDRLGLPHAAYEPLSRILITERLIGGGGASSIQEIAVGPPRAGSRAIVVAWRDARYASDLEPLERRIAGERSEGSAVR